MRSKGCNVRIPRPDLRDRALPRRLYLSRLGCRASEREDRVQGAERRPLDDERRRFALPRPHPVRRGDRDARASDSAAHGAVWSPDSTRIAYCGHDGDGNWAVWIMNTDGSGQRQLTHPKLVAPAGTGGDYPTNLSPDGTRILFSSGQHQTREIYSIALDGGDRERLTNWAGADAPNAWLPDGRIVFGHYTGDAPRPRWNVMRTARRSSRSPRSTARELRIRSPGCLPQAASESAAGDVHLRGTFVTVSSRCLAPGRGRDDHTAESEAGHLVTFSSPSRHGAWHRDVPAKVYESTAANASARVAPESGGGSLCVAATRSGLKLR
jgi:hypothetical protein